MTNERRSPNGRGFHCRLLIDLPTDGAWNMAVDEALLECAAGSEDTVWLRFYQWQEPTLSLGYFQPHADWQAHVKGPCAVVRRQTGGGAILHDRELTYSLVLPPGHPATDNTAALYDAVHTALIVTLSRFGISAELHGRRDSCSQSACDAFYCFERRSPSDVVIPCVPGGSTSRSASVAADVTRSGPPFEKICGSAQRRRKGAVLMHGSVPLTSSALAPQILGIKEVTGVMPSLAELRARWTEALVAALELPRLETVEPPGDVRLAAHDLAVGKYSSPRWTNKR